MAERRRDARSSASCSRRTTAAARSASTSNGSGRTRRRVRSWHDLHRSGGVASKRTRCGPTLASMPSRTHVVFTAHSLPERVLEGDVYVDELRKHPPKASPTLRDSTATAGRSGGSRRRGRPSRGGVPTSARSSRRWPRGGRRRRAGLPAGVHGGPSRGALRPRRRRPPTGGRRGAALRPNRDAQRRRRGAHRAGWPKCERWRHETGRRRRRRHRRPRRRVRAAAPAARRDDRRPRGV